MTGLKQVNFTAMFGTGPVRTVCTLLCCPNTWCKTPKSGRFGHTHTQPHLQEINTWHWFLFLLSPVRLKASKSKEMHSTARKITLRLSTIILRPSVRLPFSTLNLWSFCRVGWSYTTLTNQSFVFLSFCEMLMNCFCWISTGKTLKQISQWVKLLSVIEFLLPILMNFPTHVHEYFHHIANIFLVLVAGLRYYSVNSSHIFVYPCDMNFISLHPKILAQKMQVIMATGQPP